MTRSRRLGGGGDPRSKCRGRHPGGFATAQPQCRFRNCRHETEPGCAVQRALRAGALDPGRLENRRKLLREQEFLRRKIDPEARQEENRRVKALHRGARQKYEQRARDGGKR